MQLTGKVAIHPGADPALGAGTAHWPDGLAGVPALAAGVVW